jgi:toxin ParE1/3/4
MKVVYALRDLQSIDAYLAERSPSSNIQVLAALKSSITTLSYFPELGRIVDDAGHRRMPVPRYPYLIFYRVARDEILILHIRHTSRRPIDPTTEL